MMPPTHIVSPLIAVSVVALSQRHERSHDPLALPHMAWPSAVRAFIVLAYCGRGNGGHHHLQ
jgi:hypothetical protein